MKSGECDRLLAFAGEKQGAGRDTAGAGTELPGGAGCLRRREWPGESGMCAACRRSCAVAGQGPRDGRELAAREDDRGGAERAPCARQVRRGDRSCCDHTY